MTYQEAALAIDVIYKDGKRNIVLPPDVYDAFKNGLKASERFAGSLVPSVSEKLAFRDTTVRRAQFPDPELHAFLEDFLEHPIAPVTLHSRAEGVVFDLTVEDLRGVEPPPSVWEVYRP